MKPLPILLLLLLTALACPHHTNAAVVLEKRIKTNTVETRGLVTRLEDVLSRTGKRIREVFGFKLDMKAVVKPSAEDYDMLFKPPEPKKQTGILLINSRVVQNYSIEDLNISAGRALYQAIWPLFRKSALSAPVIVLRIYDAGMTAYAAELLYPGAPRWKYAGLYGSEGKERYREYLSLEKDLAGEVLAALSSAAPDERAAGFFPAPGAGARARLASAGLLSYRVMKTFEKDMDPKMIQLMGLAEFGQRLPGGLEALRQGFKGKWEQKRK